MRAAGAGGLGYRLQRREEPGDLVWADDVQASGLGNQERVDVREVGERGGDVGACERGDDRLEKSLPFLGFEAPARGAGSTSEPGSACQAVSLLVISTVKPRVWMCERPYWPGATIRAITWHGEILLLADCHTRVVVPEVLGRPRRWVA